MNDTEENFSELIIVVCFACEMIGDRVSMLVPFQKAFPAKFPGMAMTPTGKPTEVQRPGYLCKKHYVQFQTDLSV